MSIEKRTRVEFPASGVPAHLPHVTWQRVEIGRATEGAEGNEYAVYLNGHRIGSVYAALRTGGRPTHRGSNIVTRTTYAKTWKVRGDQPLGIGASAGDDTRVRAIWRLVDRHIERYGVPREQ